MFGQTQFKEPRRAFGVHTQGFRQRPHRPRTLTVTSYRGIWCALITLLSGPSIGFGAVPATNSYWYDSAPSQTIALRGAGVNNAGELSMQTEDAGNSQQETVELVGNAQGGTIRTGGRLTLRRIGSQAGAPLDTVVLSAADGYNGGRVQLRTSTGAAFLDLTAGGPDVPGEMSMFAQDIGGNNRETVQLSANSPHMTTNTGGTLTLRLIGSAAGMAQDRAILSAGGTTSAGPRGGELELRDGQGTTIFHLTSGANNSMSRPSMYMNQPGNGDSGIVLTTTGGGMIKVYDSGEDEVIRLSGSDGRVTAKVIEITGADLAEKFPISLDADIEPGMVVAIDTQNPGQLCLARGAYNHRVAGIVSGAGDLKAGTILGNVPGSEDAPPIALSGRVWCLADASVNAIEPGDLLTTSDTPGHAMEAVDRERSHGAVLGKAMTSLKKGECGLVLVLVNLQ